MLFIIYLLSTIPYFYILFNVTNKDLLAVSKCLPLLLLPIFSDTSDFIIYCLIGDYLLAYTNDITEPHFQFGILFFTLAHLSKSYFTSIFIKIPLLTSIVYFIINDNHIKNILIYIGVILLHLLNTSQMFGMILFILSDLLIILNLNYDSKYLSVVIMLLYYISVYILHVN